MIGIYKLTSPSNKVYIGQSINIEKRLKRYRFYNSKGQIKLHNALLKYRFENFSIEYLKVFENYISDKRLQLLLDGYEIYYIKKYDSIKSGYNIRGGGSRGKLSEEAKAKISKANKNKVISEEHRKNLSESHKGYIMPQEQRDKISIRSKEKGISKETRQKMIESRRGYKASKETREKSSKAHIKNKVLQYNLKMKLIKEWDCAVQASKELHFVVSCIYEACKRQDNRPYKGFIWKYKVVD